MHNAWNGMQLQYIMFGKVRWSSLLIGGKSNWLLKYFAEKDKYFDSSRAKLANELICQENKIKPRIIKLNHYYYVNGFMTSVYENLCSKLKGRIMVLSPSYG